VPEGDKVPDSVALTSFARSGNSMMRGYLEKIMGLYTGSDGDIQKKMVADLLEGFPAEGLNNKQVQVIKFHFPEKIGTWENTMQKTILLVRNPVDTIVSNFH